MIPKTNISKPATFLLTLCLFALSACGGTGGSENFSVNGDSVNNPNGNGNSSQANGLLISSDRSTINQNQSTRITVIARNKNNVAQPGVQINFGASSGLIVVERSLTNEFGEASAILSARGTQVGTLINVFATSGTTSNGPRVDLAPPIQVTSGGGTPSAAFNISGPTQLNVNGRGNYTATLTDTTPPGVANRNVSIKVVASPNGTPAFGSVSPNSLPTDNNGRVNFVYSPPNNQSGTAFIQVSTTDASPNATRTLSVTVGTPSNGQSNININGPRNLTAGSTGNYTATLLDGNGSPAANQTISISNTGPGTLSTNSLNTDNNGQISFGLTTTSSDNGTSRITASGNGVTSTLDVIVGTSGSGAGGAQFTFPDNGTQIQINQFSGVSFNLSGGPAAGGQKVTFTIDRGQIDADPNSPPAPAATNTFTTDGNGDIKFSVISADRGPATIQATGAATATLNIEFVASASSISAQANPATITPSQSSIITATVLDSSGNPLDGVSITFILDSDGTGGSNRTRLITTTNTQGQASYTFAAGPNPGFAQVRSTTAGGLSATTQFNVQP